MDNFHKERLDVFAGGDLGNRQAKLSPLDEISRKAKRSPSDELSRPEKVKACDSCGEALGRNYKECTQCHNAVEGLWEADWKACLEKESIRGGSEDEKLLAQIIFEEMEKHSYTVIDRAFALNTCSACGNELGGGPSSCSECSAALQRMWEYNAKAIKDGRMTTNENALRVGRWILRYPHRHKDTVLNAWKLTLPIFLTGQLPSNNMASFLKNVIDQKKFDFSGKIYNSFDEAYWDVLENS